MGKSKVPCFLDHAECRVPSSQRIAGSLARFDGSYL